MDVAHSELAEEVRLLRSMLRDLLKVFDFPDDHDMHPSGARIREIREAASEINREE